MRMLEKACQTEPIQNSIVSDSNKYDAQINSWYEMALNDENEEIRHHAADSLFGFYLRKKNYTMAEKYLNYFSDYDPMKKVYWGRFYKERKR